jgi:peptidoglycan/xylan/chitin deacetylase (PgdA/CDA1 family)
MPAILDVIYPRRLWHIPEKEKKIYLTFDDGPTARNSEWILDTLADHHAKATFFCVGENIERNTEAFSRIEREGHKIGNHTQKHLNGWKTNNTDYLEDVAKCAAALNSRLFRPPYGRITTPQAEALLMQGYRIVMWSVLTHDYDPLLNKQECWNFLHKSVRPGDIIVFHDNDKASENIRFLLPRMLNHYSTLEYTFEVI